MPKQEISSTSQDAFQLVENFGPNGDVLQKLFDYYSGVYELAVERRRPISRWEHSHCTSLSRL